MAELRPRMTLQFEYAPVEGWLTVNYTPLTPEGIEQREWSGGIRAATADITPTLRHQLDMLVTTLHARLPERPVTFPDGSVRDLGRPNIVRIMVPVATPRTVYVYSGTPQQMSHAASITTSQLTPDGMRLFNDILVSLEATAWKHLAERTGGPPLEDRVKVFISYRKRADIEAFAESLADRLDREGLATFFDKWDVLAGDSLPGRIEEAFAESRACIVILSNDYQKGKWATQEMRTAITKRVEGDFRLIPVVFEDAPIPELLKDAVRIDFRGHNDDQFEARVREVVQALFGLTGRRLRQARPQE